MKATMKSLVLGSTSPRRQQLLEAVGLAFTLARPDIDERAHDHEPAEQYVYRLSREKAHAVAAQGFSEALILTADTTVADEGVILGKPEDAADAEQMLYALRGRPHHVYSGVTLLDAATGQIDTIVVTSEVHMRDLTDDEISAYVASGDPFGKAGSYAIQNQQHRPVEALQGCYTNVVGLPMCMVCVLLRQYGVEAAAPPTCSPTRLPCTMPTPA